MNSDQIFDIGGVQLIVGHRTFGGDGGPAVRVIAEVEGQTVQLLRFDCFRKDPHYHFDPSGIDDKRDLDKETVPDPIGWTIEQLGGNLRAMIRTAGYGDIADSVDQDAVASVLPEIESIMRT